MRINEVEKQVGITKKNIRFYEDQGLIHPERNKANGYRDYSEADVSKKKRGAAIAAGVMIALILLWDVLILILNAWDPAPPFFIAVMIIIPTLIIVGIVLALKERMKEIDGGEEDEAAKY